MFEPGFLGTKAALYMDVVTLYFALLPFLLAFSIAYAIKGNFKAHMRSQIIILLITIVMVLVFEIGVRISGGFLEFAKTSDYSFNFLVTFLVIHVLIAVAAVIGWIYLVVSSYKAYKKDDIAGLSRHKKMGRAIFAALTLTSIMGVMFYVFLFL